MNHSLQRVQVQKKMRFFAQTGFSSLLFILLVGVSMTALTVGYMSSMRSLQSSSITAHAQTQAQIKAMIGHQALTKFLQNKVAGDFDQIATGTVKNGDVVVSSYTKVGSASCPTSNIPYAVNYCFDILGQSGEASAIVRAIYSFRNHLVSATQTGSVFAGGLLVNSNTGSNQNLFGSSVSMEVGGGVINRNTQKVYTAEELLAMGVTVTPYVPRAFITANDMKDYSNYICTVKDLAAQCVRKNLGGATEMDSTTLPTGITYENVNGVNTWSVAASTNLPAGVFWFDGNVKVTLDQNKPLVNSIVATGTISSNIPTNANSTSTFEAYAPYHYILNASSSNMADRLSTVCPATNYPLQYCSNSGALKSTSDMQLLQATVANILFLATSFALDSGKEQQAVTINYYGNLIASSGAGGTGKSSGKFTGTGVINVSGNLMVTGDADMSELTGSIAVKLSNADVKGNQIPTYIRKLHNGPIRYM